MTVRFVPCIAETGLIENSVGYPADREPADQLRDFAPVVRTTVRAPSAAPGATVMSTVAWVAL